MGWYESRSVDVEDDVKCLINDGYKCSQVGIDFLKIYSQLKGYSPSFSDSSKMERIHFVVPLAISRTYREVVGEYERRIKNSMMLVGEMHNEHMVLMVSACGKIYGGYDSYLCCFGDAFDYGLDVAILNLPAVEIE